MQRVSDFIHAQKRDLFLSALDSESRQMGIILSLAKTKKHKLMAYWQQGSLKRSAKAHFIPALTLHTYFFL